MAINMKDFDLDTLAPSEKEQEQKPTVPKYEKGDKVRVFRRPTAEECKFVGWDDHMEGGAGRVGTVLVHKPGLGVEVKFDDATDGEDSYWWPYCVVVKAIDYKAGDKVVVVRAPINRDEEGLTGGWPEQMSETIGKIGVITNKSNQDPHRLVVMTDEGLFAYADFLLEPLKEDKPIETRPFKHGDIVKVFEESYKSKKDLLWDNNMRNTTLGKVGRVIEVTSELYKVTIHGEHNAWYYPEDLRHASKWNKSKYLKESENSKK